MQRDTLHDISTHIIAATCLLIVATGGFITGSRVSEKAIPPIQTNGPGPLVGGPGPDLLDTPKREIIPLPPDVDLDRKQPPTRK